MVEVSVSQQYVVQSAEAQIGTHELALRAFTAIDQKAIRAFGNEQRRQASLGRGYCGSGSKKYQFEHDARPSAVIISACGGLGRLAPPKRSLPRPDCGEERSSGDVSPLGSIGRELSGHCW